MCICIYINIYLCVYIYRIITLYIGEYGNACKEIRMFILVFLHIYYYDIISNCAFIFSADKSLSRLLTKDDVPFSSEVALDNVGSKYAE